MKKIEYAVGAAGVFIGHLHQEDFDRGMIATFGNSFHVEQAFTGDETRLHAALARVAKSVNNERTRLYDSIEDVISEFWRNGTRDRSWLLTVITDGQDNESTRYPHADPVSPARIGHYVAQRFNHEPSNFPFLIGVGEGHQINEVALGQVGDYGCFPAMTIAAFPLLEMAFLHVAVQVSSQLIGRRIDVGNLSWAEVAQIRCLARSPIDYAFLIDRSGSMNESG